MLRLKPQDRVDVVSRRGRVRNIELRVTETVAPGQLFVPFHYAEANANEVTQSAFDPISREPNYKQSAARVERTQAGSGEHGASLLKRWSRKPAPRVTDPRPVVPEPLVAMPAAAPRGDAR